VTGNACYGVVLSVEYCEVYKVVSYVDYFIGGSSRCGKTTLARAVRRNMDVQTLSGDALRDTLRKSTSADTLPELHRQRAETIPDEQEFVDYHTLRTKEEITKKRAQASLVWSFMKNYLVTVNRESTTDDVVVESIDVWPDLLAVSGLRHRAVFMVDTSMQQWERIAATREVDPHDWMHANNYSDARIKAWSVFNVQRSELVKGLCDEHEYPYVDLAETGFEQSQQNALDLLLTQPLRNA
jgi:hypothetical protein